MVSLNIGERASVKDASIYHGYSIQYLRRLLRAGRLKGIKIVQVWLIDVEGLEEDLLKANRFSDKRWGPK